MIAFALFLEKNYYRGCKGRLHIKIYKIFFVIVCVLQCKTKENKTKLFLIPVYTYKLQRFVFPPSAVQNDPHISLIPARLGFLILAHNNPTTLVSLKF